MSEPTGSSNLQFSDKEMRLVQLCGCGLCSTYTKKDQNIVIIYTILRLGDLSDRSLQLFACFPLMATLFCFEAAEFLMP
jgi:hypothetical protein